MKNKKTSNKKKNKAQKKKPSRNAKFAGQAKVAAKKRLALKKTAPKKAVVAKRKPGFKAKAAGGTRKPVPPAVGRGSQDVETVAVVPKRLRARPGAGTGDLQGISSVESVDSESAEELLEEGQAFEAGIISGVEDAPDADQGGVKTHEVKQDDVPPEYQDKDRI